MNEDPKPEITPDADIVDFDPEALESDPPDETEWGPLLEYEQGLALEAHDRQHAGPGGEPDCPACGAGMIRSVEQHPAPRSDDSPFRVRLVCGAPDCRSWTAYNW